MERYDYKEAVKNDVVEYIDNEVDLKEYAGDRDGLLRDLYHDLQINDSVTGSASGSYYRNVQEAEDALRHNLDLLAEACHEFGDENVGQYLESPESADVTIRCYVLSNAIEEAVSEIEKRDGIDLEDEYTFEEPEEINEREE